MFDKKSLSITAFTLSGASIAAIHLGLIATIGLFGHGHELISMLGSFLLGFEATGPGIFIGLTWGFLFGGVYGFIFSWLYNKML